MNFRIFCFGEFLVGWGFRGVKSEVGFYFMELLDEISRSELLVSFGGGGGGSLSGIVVKVGDFLEKNISCYFGEGRDFEEVGMFFFGFCFLVGR